MSDLRMLAKEWHDAKLKQNQIQREKLGKVIDAIIDRVEAIEQPERAKKVDEALSASALLREMPTMKFLAFKAGAKKLLGDDMPETKDEIVAALRTMQEAA